MALTELELKRFERAVSKFVERRRPAPHIRPKLDIGFRFKGQSVEIFEVRPHWQGRDEVMENSVAKATFVKHGHEWRIYWQRADLKWHRYVPHPTASDIEEFLQVVDEDAHCCFFG
jgi:hypothetical protein